VRNVASFRERVESDTRHPRETHTMRVKARIDSAIGREQYGQRFATDEPVFATLRHNRRLDRFTLRWRTKGDGQWKPLCLVHNIEKLANAGYAAYAARGNPRVDTQRVSYAYDLHEKSSMGSARRYATRERARKRLIVQPQRGLLLRADRLMLRNARIVGPLGNSKHR
jgi:hypothetical protein